jgi:NAD(P)-dependent dehydrogenase (short-subunit alcohol dehydrogenase family)
MPAVLITGANRGIGLEFARQFAANGWDVFASCRNSMAAKELATLARSSGDKLTVLGIDVTDGESVRSAARRGNRPAHNLRCTGAAGHIDYENWAQVLDVNTMGPLGHRGF